jgi:hypothetical protein
MQRLSRLLAWGYFLQQPLTCQQSNANQHNSLRSRWSSSTRSRISSLRRDTGGISTWNVTPTNLTIAGNTIN